MSVSTNMERPSLNGWETRAQDGGIPFLEHREGHRVIRFRSGAPVAVSLDHGRTWTHGTRPVHSIYLATIAAHVILIRLRAERAARATSGGLSVQERLALRAHVPRGTREAGPRCARQAPEAPSGAARAARREGEKTTRRVSGDSAPRHVRFDDPRAADLARAYVRSELRPSVEGSAGDDSLFGVAVAIVRGFCLWPDGLGGIVLEEWNRSEAKPPWNPQRLRRSLERAERFGSLPWGVLLSKSAEGRALWGEWLRSAGEGVRGRAPR